MTDTSRVVASLRFRADQGTGGEWRLFENATLLLVPSEALQDAMAEVTERVDQNAFKWGTSLVVGIAAVGTAVFMKGNRKVGWGLYALSGFSGWVAANARRGIRNWGSSIFQPRALDQVTVTEDAEGLTFAVQLVRHAPSWTLRIESGDYDSAEAAQFLTEIGRMRTEKMGEAE